MNKTPDHSTSQTPAQTAAHDQPSIQEGMPISNGHEPYPAHDDQHGQTVHAPETRPGTGSTQDQAETPHTQREPSPRPQPGPAHVADTMHDLANQIDWREQQASTPNNSTNGVASGLLRLLADNLAHLPPREARHASLLLERQSRSLRHPLHPAFWQAGARVLGYQLRTQLAWIERRRRGAYQIDPYGLDMDMVAMLRPLLTFLYRVWWRITPYGLEHVPASGPALLVSNHSGVLPWDGAMIAAAVYLDHPTPEPRIVRTLFLNWFNTIPVLAPTLTGLGQMSALPENAIRLLHDGELVCTFPEGAKGMGKLYRDRYRLARFGRGGFAQIALRTGAPLIPVAVVGAEEIYPMVWNARPLARLLGTPFFPVTPFFPLFGVLGMIPLPARWSITFCPPIETASYGPHAADDPLAVFDLSERVRSIVQETINMRLAERRSIF